ANSAAGPNVGLDGPPPASDLAIAPFSDDGPPPGADLATPPDLGPGPDLAPPPPALTDLSPPTSTVAAGITFNLTALFSGKNFGVQPVAVHFEADDPTVVMVPADGALAFNQSQLRAVFVALKVGQATVTATA